MVINELVSLTLSYSDGLVRHIPDVSAFLVVRRIPLAVKGRRPCSIFITPTPSKECQDYLGIRLNKRYLDPANIREITYGN